MTAADLIALLSAVDPGRLVVLQADGEGNAYSPLAGVDANCGYEARTTWAGEVRKQTLTAADEAAGYGDDDVAGPAAVPCVVLFPVN